MQPTAVPQPIGTPLVPYSIPGYSSQQAQAGVGQAQTVGGRNALIRKEWTPEEDAIIRYGVEHKHGWRHIASQLPGRSDDAVRNRWKRLKEPSDGPPTTPPGLPGGTAEAKEPKPAKPKQERVTWSPAEDAIICSSVQQYGHKWGSIAQRLPGRTEHAIRNRYQRLLTISDAARGA